ncbi:MAG: hypothetical protein U5O39_16200 [Gammaproteobacteria bacterium]|nr:hypothetical protein [Gammaproteobacteria bacterium]
MSGYTQGKLEEAKVSISLPFLQKPFTPRKLAARVREVLDAPLVMVE